MATLTDSHLPFSRPNVVSIIDLDADGAPEWLFDHGQSFELVAWVADRFQINYLTHNHAARTVPATISLAPQLEPSI